MGRIKQVTKLTEKPHLNLYHVEGENKNSRPVNYYVASRAKTVEDLKLKSHENPADGVVIFSVYGPKRDRIVLVRQYRYSIDDFIYEFPAGLVDEGENYHQAAIREMKEETGFLLEPIPADPCFERPYFTTIGMTDESCATVYGYVDGDSSTEYLEDNEELQVVLADRDEVRRILREEKVAIKCAYMLMHFLADEDVFAFLEVPL